MVDRSRWLRGLGVAVGLVLAGAAPALAAEVVPPETTVTVTMPDPLDVDEVVEPADSAVTQKPTTGYDGSLTDVSDLPDRLRDQTDALIGTVDQLEAPTSPTIQPRVEVLGRDDTQRLPSPIGGPGAASSGGVVAFIDEPDPRPVTQALASAVGDYAVPLGLAALIVAFLVTRPATRLLTGGAGGSDDARADELLPFA